MSIPFGTQLAGRYQLDELLRRGSGVTTYGGVDLASGQPIVVKELRIGELGEWKEYDLFNREAQTLEALRHPGIPRMLAHFTSEEPPAAYLVMERVPGRSLDKRLAEGRPMTVQEVVRILVAVLRILEHLHSLAPPIIHRDVKPGNIVVSPERVCLVDFGGVRRFLPWAPNGSTMIGTFGYMAPEQLHGDATPATDLFSIGATVAALLAGVDASNLPRDGLRIDLGRIPAARPPLRELVGKLVEPEPSQRFRSAAEALAALARAGLQDDGTQAALPTLLAPHGQLAPAHRAAAPPMMDPVYAVTTDPGGTLASAPAASYWTARSFVRWSLFGVGGASLLAAVGLELVRWLLLDKLSFLGDAAMVLSQLGLGLTVGGFFVRTKAGYRKKLLRLARKQGGCVHVAEATERIGLPPERAQELLEELVATGLGRHDPEVAGLYWIGV